MENDKQEDKTFALTDEQLALLEQEREMPISGQSNLISREGAKQIIRGEGDF